MTILSLSQENRMIYNFSSLYEKRIKSGRGSLSQINDLVSQYISQVKVEILPERTFLDRIKKRLGIKVIGNYKNLEKIPHSEPLISTLKSAINSKRDFYQTDTSFIGSIAACYSECCGEISKAKKLMGILSEMDKAIETAKSLRKNYIRQS